ncbi:23S rRNA (adenine(2503)-C(2))-methyltransferase RlmN [Candidatus Aerophobetes bacterium]|nr:23S rRNA (adenine(2503)-C(2))-methyltransferase RlmN [Candidatus Aerophobetes bacterium]
MEKIDNRINVKEKQLDELCGFFKEIREPVYKGRQLFTWLWKKGIDDFSLYSDFSKKLREHLKAYYYIGRLHINDYLLSSDGTCKYIFSRETGDIIESVFIPSNDRRTVCISTQVGCPLKCSFCATGQGKFKGDLLAWEIADQVLQIIKHQGVQVTNVVLMGMGEPFLNWENTKKALHIINSSYGISIGSRKITVSTAGIIPGIYDLTDFPLQVRLAVSLNSAIQEKRDKIMPVARKYLLFDLKKAIKFYYNKKHRMVTLEYVLIHKFNTSREDFLALKEFTKNLKVKINLIPLNFNQNIPFLPPSEKEINYFYNLCLFLPYPVTIRESKGKDIKAACGQLVNK